MVSPIRRIDQIYCRAESVGDVNKLYYLFSNILGFPEAWPPIDRKTYYGGGVYTGNTWLKWTTPNRKLYEMTDKPARFSSIMAEPIEYAKSLKEVEKRGFTHGPDRVQTSEDPSGKEVEWCWSSGIADSPFSKFGLTFCRYTPFAFSAHTTTPEAKDLHEHYRILRERLDASGGGPMGIRHVGEVELGVVDYGKSVADWQRLLDPVKPVGAGVWRVGSGPVVRLTEDTGYSIKSISVRVKSLRTARRFLKMNGLLGEDKDNMVSIDRVKVNNLDIRFVK